MADFLDFLIRLYGCKIHLLMSKTLEDDFLRRLEVKASEVKSELKKDESRSFIDMLCLLAKDYYTHKGEVDEKIQADSKARRTIELVASIVFLALSFWLNK